MRQHPNQATQKGMRDSRFKMTSSFHMRNEGLMCAGCVQMLRPEEVEMLVCGNPTLVMGELKKVTAYDGYTAQDSTIRWAAAAMSGVWEGTGGDNGQLYCPVGVSPVAKLAGFCQGKPAATVTLPNPPCMLGVIAFP